MGVTIILWLVLTGMLLWPIAWMITAYGDRKITDTFVLIVATILAGIASFLVVRLVFPMEYASEPKQPIIRNS